MYDNHPYQYFRSQDSMGGFSAHEAARRHLGDATGLVTLPYFALPPVGEKFDDTQGRFPANMLEEVRKFLMSADDSGTRYWFARVLPEKEGGNIEYLALDLHLGDWKLVREWPTQTDRYIGTMGLEELEGYERPE